MNGYGFECLTKESYNQILELYKENIIGKKQFISLSQSKNYAHLIKTLNAHFSISDMVAIKLHWRCYMELQEWRYADKPNSSVFNECQNVLWKKLMKNNGILERKNLSNRLNGLTEHQIDTHVTALVKMNIILHLKVRRNMGGKTIYVINPLYVNDLKNG